MKDFACILALVSPSSICCVAAGYLTVNGIVGWGWFLFVGVLLAGVKYKGERYD